MASKSSPFYGFDWKNGEITQRHKDYMQAWALNEIEILLGTQPTNEELAGKYLAEICKSANITYNNIVFVDSPKQLLDSVWASVGASVGASVRVSVRDSVGASVRVSVWDSVGDSVGASVRHSVRAWYDADWQLYHFYSQEFGKNALEPYCKLLEQITGLLKIDNDIYLVRKPIRLVRNAEGRLHYDHDKAIEWADGYGFYYLNGVEFDEKTWQKIVDEKFTMKDLASGDLGADQRAVAIQMLRPDRLLKQVGAKLIDTGSRGVELYEVAHFSQKIGIESAEDTTEYCVKMKHPTLDKYYIEWVTPEYGKKGSADEWMAFSRSLPLEDYLTSELA